MAVKSMIQLACQMYVLKFLRYYIIAKYLKFILGWKKSILILFMYHTPTLCCIVYIL